jgi:hypothetical protein
MFEWAKVAAAQGNLAEARHALEKGFWLCQEEIHDEETDTLIFLTTERLNWNIESAKVSRSLLLLRSRSQLNADEGPHAFTLEQLEGFVKDNEAQYNLDCADFRRLKMLRDRRQNLLRSLEGILDNFTNPTIAWEVWKARCRRVQSMWERLEELRLSHVLARLDASVLSRRSEHTKVKASNRHLEPDEETLLGPRRIPVAASEAYAEVQKEMRNELAAFGATSQANGNAGMRLLVVLIELVRKAARGARPAKTEMETIVEYAENIKKNKGMWIHGMEAWKKRVLDDNGVTPTNCAARSSTLQDNLRNSGQAVMFLKNLEEIIQSELREVEMVRQLQEQKMELYTKEDLQKLFVSKGRSTFSPSTSTTLDLKERCDELGAKHIRDHAVFTRLSETICSDSDLHCSVYRKQYSRYRVPLMSRRCGHHACESCVEKLTNPHEDNDCPGCEVSPRIS